VGPPFAEATWSRSWKQSPKQTSTGRDSLQTCPHRCWAGCGDVSDPTGGGAEPRPERGAHDIDPSLLEFLVCPLTKATLEYDRDAQELISRAARLAYPIRDGIPIMLPEEARTLDDNDG